MFNDIINAKDKKLKPITLDQAIKDFNSIREEIIKFINSHNYKEYIQLDDSLSKPMTPAKFKEADWGGEKETSFVVTAFRLPRQDAKKIDIEKGVKIHDDDDSIEYWEKFVPALKGICAKSKYYHLDDESYKGPHRPYIVFNSDEYIVTI